MNIRAYRCWPCGLPLVLNTPESMKKHVGHKWTEAKGIKWYEIPRVLYWDIKYYGWKQTYKEVYQWVRR